ncbi:serine hydrolase domain-containing protein [Winogradskya consettensis]|uniref:Peptidase n=2 Tax=Winogradskya consettensis TaxID=113560 RepID=A0A919VSY0_9ACTN|nr:peptidase [Actinoplanes consettensis]
MDGRLWLMRLLRTTMSAVVLAAGLAVATSAPAQAAGSLNTAAQAGGSLDTAALEASLAGLPDAEASAALVQVRGSAGSWSGAAGHASVRSERPPAADSRFRIGSMTKVFTATVVLQLAAEGKLSLDGTVQQYVPGFLPASYAPITVRNLLTFTSGLNHVSVPHKTPAWFFEHRYDHWAPGSQIDLTQDLAFTPGESQRYGNVDYIMAGLVVEKVTGHTWADEVNRRIIRPLHLNGTSTPGDDIRIPGPHAHGYEVTADGRRDVTLANTTLQWSAASIISTAGDLDRLMVALFSGRLLPRPQLDEMFTVPAGITMFGTDTPAGYSAGLQRLDLGGTVIWGKSGDRPGYNNGMGATRDLSRRIVYSVNTLKMGGDQPVRAQRIIMAALSSGNR